MAQLNVKTIAIILAVAVVVLFLINGMEMMAPTLDLGYNRQLGDTNTPNLFGTAADKYARWENLSVRPEYYKKQGHHHVCKCGYPSKRMLDAYGGSHHRLTHLCAPCVGGKTEPEQLASWWTRKGCGDPSSRGLNIRPYCTRC